MSLLEDLLIGGAVVGVAGFLGYLYLRSPGSTQPPPPPPPPPPPTGPTPTRIVLSNVSAPYVVPATVEGSRVNQPIGPLLSPLGPSQPPAGTVWILREVSLTVVTGPGSPVTAGGAYLYAFPLDPASPGGDGAVLANATRGAAGTTATGTGGPGTGTSSRFALQWPQAFPLTPSMVIYLSTLLVAGDSVTMELTIDQYDLASQQQEVLLGFGSPFAGYPVVPGSVQVSPAGTWEGQAAPNGPPAGMVWVPVSAEVNLAEGTTPGDRSAEIFAGPAGATEEGGLVFAESGPLDTPGVGNNNATGTWTPGSTSGTPTAPHVQLDPAYVLQPGESFYVGYDALAGDAVKFRAVFLQQPSNYPLPWQWAAGA